MTIQQTIKKAIEGGYRLGSSLGLNTRKETIKLFDVNKNTARDIREYWNIALLDPSFWKALGKALGWTGEKIRMCFGCGITLRWNEEPTMDGKHGGKNGCGSDIEEYEGQWLIEMHRLIDHLAEGKSIESFFKELI
ncbi:MAG TPA: hypothetical protein ENI23_05275 [bacterium]|nr:hypothetical protein [bacterium]